MKRTRILLLTCCLLSMTALAIPQALATTATAQEMAAQNVTINGKVSAITDSSLTVVDSEKMEQIVTINPKTKVKKAGKAAKLTDIKADDTVVVVATKGEGKALTAVSIEVS